MLSILDISVYTSLFNPLTDFEVGIIGNFVLHVRKSKFRKER